jgi:hypothetical protein
MIKNNNIEFTMEEVKLRDPNQRPTQEILKKKPIGKLLPLVVDVKSKKQVDDVLTVVKYKITMK